MLYLEERSGKKAGRQAGESPPNLELELVLDPEQLYS